MTSGGKAVCDEYTSLTEGTMRHSAYTEAPATWIRSALYSFMGIIVTMGHGSSDTEIFSGPAKNVPSFVEVAIEHYRMIAILSLMFG